MFLEKTVVFRSTSVVISKPWSQDSSALEFILSSSWSRSRDLMAKVSVLVSRPKKGLDYNTASDLKMFPYWKRAYRVPELIRSSAVSPQVTEVTEDPAVGCHYFPPDPRLPPQPPNITAHWPVPSYTAW